jgi:thiol-disulfide isomerase/thioredoxin
VLIVLRRLLRPHDKEVWSRTDDLLTSAFGLGFIAWKATPLVTRTAEIADRPLRLLYYPGGLAGLLAGIGVAVVYLAIVVRKPRDGSRLQRAHLVHATLVVAALALGPATNAVVQAATAADRYEIRASELDYLQGGELVRDDRPTVLVFWATWCGPCTAQMPELARFWSQSRDDANLIAVNLIDTEPGTGVVSAYLLESGLELPVVLDYGGDLSRYLGVSATPTTVILDPGGGEVFRRTGAVSSANLRRRVLPYAQ